MSDLQMQAMDIISNMPEEKLVILVKFLEVFSEPRITNIANAGKNTSRRIGIAEGERLYDPDYDLDEYNDEIAQLFGVN